MKQEHFMEHQSLALLGGQPIASHLTYPSWPPVDEQTALALVEVYRSGCWSFQCPQERSFSSKFATYHDAAYGVFVMNGTVALQCALHACGIQAGDEVIVPAVTWIATATAPAHIGAIPVFVDIEPTTFCIDPQHIEAALRRKRARFSLSISTVQQQIWKPSALWHDAISSRSLKIAHTPMEESGMAAALEVGEMWELSVFNNQK